MNRYRDFEVQFRAAVGDAGSERAQEEMSQAVQDFQRLCQDYLYIERLNGTSLQQNYIPQYSIRGSSPEDAAADIASAERNRLGLGDGPLLNLREVLEDDVALRVFSTDLPSLCGGPVCLYRGTGWLHRGQRAPSTGTKTLVDGPRIWTLPDQPLPLRDIHTGRLPARSIGGEVCGRLCPLFSHCRRQA